MIIDLYDANKALERAVRDEFGPRVQTLSRGDDNDGVKMLDARKVSVGARNRRLVFGFTGDIETLDIADRAEIIWRDGDVVALSSAIRAVFKVEADVGTVDFGDRNDRDEFRRHTARIQFLGEIWDFVVEWAREYERTHDVSVLFCTAKKPTFSVERKYDRSTKSHTVHVLVDHVSDEWELENSPRPFSGVTPIATIASAIAESRYTEGFADHDSLCSELEQALSPDGLRVESRKAAKKKVREWSRTAALWFNAVWPRDQDPNNDASLFKGLSLAPRLATTSA